MLAIQTLLTVTILVLFFAKFRIGLCVYIAYLFLVPYCNLNVAGVSFGWNLINTVLFLAYCIDCRKKCGKIRLAYKPFIPFFLLYGLLLLEMPFQDGVPIGYAMNGWRLALFNLVLPIVVLSTAQYDQKIGKYTLTTMICVCVVVIVYAFVLIPLQGVNPYIMELTNANNAELMEAQFGEQSNRLMIKISSVFAHPMTFGAFLGIYIYSQLFNNRNIILWVIIIGLISCIFLCGIRTPIAALLVTIAVYLLLKRNLKAFFSVFLLTIIGYCIIIQTPALSETMLSMLDRNSSNVGGSSIEMRLEQLNAAFDEVQNCMLFGKGFGYNGYYWSLHGAHPKLYSFESLIFVILCNYGIIGFLIWGIMFYKIYRYSQKMVPKSLSICIIMLLTYYVSYTCITGEFGYIKFFIFIYSLMIVNTYSQYKNHNNYLR